MDRREPSEMKVGTWVRCNEHVQSVLRIYSRDNESILVSSLGIGQIIDSPSEHHEILYTSDRSVRFLVGERLMDFDWLSVDGLTIVMPTEAERIAWTVATLTR